MAAVDELLSIPEVARRLGLSTEAAFDLVVARQLRSVESSTGRRLVPAGTVAAWIAAHPVPA